MARQRKRFVGVELRGGVSAGADSWVVTGRVQHPASRLEACQRLERLPGSAPDDREIAHAALVQFIAKQRSSVVALTTPFGLPRTLAGTSDWLEFVAGFTDRYPSLEEFQRHCAKRADGREVWRATDRRHARRVAVFKRRWAHRTYFGLRNVIAPLVVHGHATAWPMQESEPGKPVLIEVAPEVVGRVGGVGVAFKGQLPVAADSRRDALARWCEREGLDAGAIESDVVEDSTTTALGAVIAAGVAARCCAALPDPPADAAQGVEGTLVV